MLQDNNTEKAAITPTSKAAAIIRSLEETRQNVVALKCVWEEYIGEPIPDDRQFRTWLTKPVFGGIETVDEAIREVGGWLNMHSQALEVIREKREARPKEIKEHTKTFTDLVRYASGIMVKKERGDKYD